MSLLFFILIGYGTDIIFKFAGIFRHYLAYLFQELIIFSFYFSNFVITGTYYNWITSKIGL